MPTGCVINHDMKNKFLISLAVLLVASDACAMQSIVGQWSKRESSTPEVAAKVPYTHPSVRKCIAKHGGLLRTLNQHMLAAKKRKVAEEAVERLREETRDYVKIAQDVLEDADDVAEMLERGEALAKKIQGQIDSAGITPDDLCETYETSDEALLRWYQETLRRAEAIDLLSRDVHAEEVRESFGRQAEEFRAEVFRCIALCRLCEWSEALPCATLDRKEAERMLGWLTPAGLERYVQSFDPYHTAEEWCVSSGIAQIDVKHVAYCVQQYGGEEFHSRFMDWLKGLIAVKSRSGAEVLAEYHANGYHKESVAKLCNQRTSTYVRYRDECGNAWLVTTTEDNLFVMLVPSYSDKREHNNLIDEFDRAAEVYRCVAQQTLGAEYHVCLDWLTDAGVKLFVSAKLHDKESVRRALQNYGTESLRAAFDQWYVLESQPINVLDRVLDRSKDECVVLWCHQGKEDDPAVDLCTQGHYKVGEHIDELCNYLTDKLEGLNERLERPQHPDYWWCEAYLECVLEFAFLQPTRGGGGDARHSKRLALEKCGVTSEVAQEIARMAVPSLPEALNNPDYYYFPTEVHRCTAGEIMPNDHREFSEALDPVFAIRKSSMSADGGATSSVPGIDQNGPFVGLRLDISALHKYLTVGAGEDNSDKKLLSAFDAAMGKVFVKITYGESPIKPLVSLLNGAAAILRGIGVYRGYFKDLATKVVELHLRAMSRTFYKECVLKYETENALKAIAALAYEQYYDHSSRRLTHQLTAVSTKSLMDDAFEAIKQDPDFAPELRAKIEENLSKRTSSLSKSWNL